MKNVQNVSTSKTQLKNFAAPRIYETPLLVQKVKYLGLVLHSKLKWSVSRKR